MGLTALSSETHYINCVFIYLKTYDDKQKTYAAKMPILMAFPTLMGSDRRPWVIVLDLTREVEV